MGKVYARARQQSAQLVEPATCQDLGTRSLLLKFNSLTENLWDSYLEFDGSQEAILNAQVSNGQWFFFALSVTSGQDIIAQVNGTVHTTPTQ